MLSVPGIAEDVSFCVHAGKMCGRAGLIGAERRGAAEAIVGLRHNSSGQISVTGRPVRINSPGEAPRLGVAYLAEDRPWDAIAFRTISTTLRHFFSDRKEGTFRLHAGEILPPK